MGLIFWMVLRAHMIIIFLKLKQNDIDIEEIVRIINEEYENQDTLKIKKLNRLQK